MYDGFPPRFSYSGFTLAGMTNTLDYRFLAKKQNSLGGNDKLVRGMTKCCHPGQRIFAA
jgi:hypothetical protein